MKSPKLIQYPYLVLLLSERSIHGHYIALNVLVRVFDAMFINNVDHDNNDQNKVGDDDDDENICSPLRSFNLQQFPQVFDLFNKFLKRLDRFLVSLVFMFALTI